LGERCDPVAERVAAEQLDRGVLDGGRGVRPVVNGLAQPGQARQRQAHPARDWRVERVTRHLAEEALEHAAAPRGAKRERVRGEHVTC
jgi:hypothetical protein